MTSAPDIGGRLTALRSRLDEVRGHRASVQANLARARASVKALEEEEQITSLCCVLIRELIDKKVTEAVQAVESLLTEGLRVVFHDQDLSVKAQVEVSRGKVSVEFMTIQHQADGRVTRGLSRDAYGGAVTTVQSILLRLIVAMRRGLRPVIFLDESLPAFDGNYVQAMGQFLRGLCDKLGFDVLLVTHNPAMLECADAAYRITKVSGAATFKRTH